MSLDYKGQDWKLKPGGWVASRVILSTSVLYLQTHITHTDTQIHTLGPPLAVQSVKNPLEMQETTCSAGNPDLGQEDPLEKEMATHSSILAWEIPWTEEPGRLQSTGS